MIRQPIVTLVGHVDHGKTSILDLIRKSSVAKREAGGITQAIGATSVPVETIKSICGGLLVAAKIKITIPGILFLDTPGHAAFNNLRKRGGNLADIAVLVIDVNEGMQPQTIESIEILKQYKTPFVIALNKIDLIPGWRTQKDEIIVNNLKKQSTNVNNHLDTKLYELIGKLFDLGFESERFDRVSDYTKQIAVIPISAKTGEGLPELIMVLTGLAQKFLEGCLECNTEGYAKGTVLEVKEEKGIGKTLDVVLYDGHLKINDLIVIGGLEEPIVTKVKILLQPDELAEIRDKKSKFRQVKIINAASGVKISAVGIEEVVAGMPIRSCSEKELEKVKEDVQKEVEEVLIDVDKKGVIVKADSLGSLEALVGLLKDKDINIKKASIGEINKNDIADADSEKDEMNKVILGFNVNVSTGVDVGKIKIITNEVIYKIIEDFEKWKEEKNKEIELKALERVVKPCKLRIMHGFVFRQSSPAVVGVEILGGSLKIDTGLIRDDKEICRVKSIQLEGESIEKAEKKMEVAIALPGVTVGRQIKEGDVLFANLSEGDFKELKKKKQYLKNDEIEVLKEFCTLKRKKDPMWGV